MLCTWISVGYFFSSSVFSDFHVGDNVVITFFAYKGSIIMLLGNIDYDQEIIFYFVHIRSIFWKKFFYMFYNIRFTIIQYKVFRFSVLLVNISSFIIWSIRKRPNSYPQVQLSNMLLLPVYMCAPLATPKVGGHVSPSGLTPLVWKEY